MEKAKSSTGRKGQKGRTSKYDITYRRHIAKQYAEGDQSLSQVALRNGLTRDQVKDWVKAFSSELAEEPIVIPMTEQEQKDFEALKKQNEALKKKLEYEQMKSFALETMIDLAKTELNIDLRKNSGAKQPKE
jgi:transposase-like protein